MRTRGTTMLELLTVLAIIGVLAGLSLNGVSGLLTKTRQVGAVREVLMLVHEARSEARGRNQPVRLEVGPVVAGQVEVRWGRLPCSDPWGRVCPDLACHSATCEGGCPCERRSDIVRVPTTVTMTNLDGLCFVGGTAVPRGGACDAATAPVSAVRFDIEGMTAPYLIVLEPLTGLPRLVDCGRQPKDGACP